MRNQTKRLPAAPQQALLHNVQGILIPEKRARQRFQRRLKGHHYLGASKPVGEQLYYVAVNAPGDWLALLPFSAAAKHLKAREKWIGWTVAQCARRLTQPSAGL